jgi:hypothetical protein
MPRLAAHRVLRLTAKIAMGLVAFVVLAPVVAFLGYDAIHFQSRWPEITRLLEAATEEERDPPENLVRLIRATSPHGLALPASTMLMDELKVRDPRTSNAHWQLAGALWWALTWLHLSEMQQISFIASRQYMGRDAGPGQGLLLRGYSAASQSLFQRPLAALSLREAAMIVILPRHANLRWRNPGELAKRRDFLLTRLQTGS